MSADAQRIRAIFLAAVEHHASGQGESYLDEACAGDGELRGSGRIASASASTAE
jgi:hypothetical protein